MKRATKWLAFTVIMAMMAAALLAGPASALAQTTTEGVAVESATETAPATTGKIEALVWDDSINPDGVYNATELIDGIVVELYKENTEDGTWVLYDKKKTGPGSFLHNPAIDYQHGWIGWENLPLDPADPVLYPWGRVTRYKLELVFDNSYKPINGGTRIVELSPWNFYWMYFYPMAWYEGWSAPQIQSTSVTISGTVWYDSNCDQIKQWSELLYFPQEGWTVVLTNRYGSKVATAKTNVNGYYYFRGLKAGTYKVWISYRCGWKQVAPYYKFFTWPPWGCEKGSRTVDGAIGKYYNDNDFGMLDMRESVWAPLYYALWWIGLLQYQFQY